MSQAKSESGVQVKQVAGHIGAEITGVDLKYRLSDEAVHDIRKALLKHRVVFFRGQNIDHAQQIEFTSRFGEVTYAHPHEDDPIDEYPQLLPIDRTRYEKRTGVKRASYESRWHTDVTAAINPPAASILRAVNVPAIGGDTHWTNQVAAYEALSTPLRALLDGLKAEHRFGARVKPGSNYARYSRADNLAGNPLVSIHPVVRVHPETGEKALYVNPGFTSHIIGVTARESEHLLNLLFEHQSQTAFTVRFRWYNGDIAFWDNRSTAHLAPLDLDHLDVERVLYRTTLTGDVPVGPDGFKSKSISGEFFGSQKPKDLLLKKEAQPKEAQPNEARPVRELAEAPAN